MTRGSRRSTPTGWFKIPILAAIAVAVLVFGLPKSTLPVHAAGSITLPRTTVPQAAKVAVQGSGFSANDTVIVYIDASVSGHGRRIQTTATTNGNGSFTAYLNLPRWTDENTYTLTSKDSHGVTATSKLQVLPMVMLRASAGATAVTVVAPRGFFVDATGFATNEQLKIQATFTNYNGNTVVVTRTPTTNGNGGVFGVGFNTPKMAKVGWATVNATGATSNKQANGRIYVTYRASVSLKNSSINSGQSAVVIGQGFVQNSQVRIEINLGGGQTLSVTASTDQNGDFTKYVRIPNYASAGSYTVTAIDASTGFKRYAKLNISTPKQAAPTATPKPSPKPTATPKPSPKQTFHASGEVLPKMTLPNQYVTFSGHGYPANASITVSTTVDMRGGGNRVITKNTYADSNGNFTIAFRVPYKAAPGTYGVTASGSGVQATSQLQVLSFKSHPKFLNFQWTSLWYHTVRHGTWDEIVIQSTLKTQLGIWLHVIFPSGVRHDYYTQTDNNGHWAVKYSVPHNATSKHSNQGYITMQLWHGKQTTQSFINFTVV